VANQPKYKNVPAPSKLLDWQGQTAVVIASGPSLTTEACEIVRLGPLGVRTIAVNRAFERAPWAEVVYMGDRRCLQQYHKQVPSLSQLWSNDSMAAEMFGACWARYVYEPGISPTRIRGNGNSGMQAINLAALFGAKRILLLGFDMKRGPNGERHFHPDHPAPLTQEQPFSDWIFKGKKVADDLRALGVDCVDCTPGGALEGFAKGDIGEELKR